MDEAWFATTSLERRGARNAGGHNEELTSHFSVIYLTQGPRVPFCLYSSVKSGTGGQVTVGTSHPQNIVGVGDPVVASESSVSSQSNKGWTSTKRLRSPVGLSSMRRSTPC
ncbi:hypothetical protein F4776DRAFT_257344 [Hypoxylon sp. NC0597]|nr:hypothetical protein F4776DRAFT_257344 [Hypoxylon sp. NC0597]